MRYLGSGLRGIYASDFITKMRLLLGLFFSLSSYPLFLFDPYYNQCDQKKIAKWLLKLPKIDFTGKMIGFDTFTKIA